MSEGPILQLAPTPAAPEPDAVSETAESIQQTTAAQQPEALPRLDESQLTDAEKKAINDFIQKVDVTNPDHVLLFGADAQKRIADFSQTALDAVKTQDTGEVGNMLVNLVSELKGFERDTEEKKGLARLFAKGEDKIERMKARYSKVSTNVENIAGSLEAYQTQLLKDVAMFDRLYDQNSDYFHQLTLYIIAGDKKLEQVRNTELKELREKAEQSQDAMDAQKANDLAAQCDRFEKKLYDLKLTRQVSIQMAPQIRLVQNNDTLMTEKIQSTLVNTIPLWKSQMLIALGIAHSKEAVKAQNEVSEMTNKMLKQNAENLKMATIETAKESERGIVDIQTLTETNKKLIETLEEVKRIQTEGREKRLAAQTELRRIETELQRELTDVVNK